MSLKKIVPIFAVAALVGGVGYWMLKRPLPQWPQPEPQDFSACPDMPSKERRWRGASFKYPRHWVIREAKAWGKGDKALLINSQSHEDEINRWQLLALAEYKGARKNQRVVEEEWKGSLDPAQYEVLMTLHPGTMRKHMVGDRKAVIYMQRGLHLMPRENDQWIMIVEGKPAYQLFGAPQFNPYRHTKNMRIVLDKEWESLNTELSCGFWMIANSLRISSR